jgi:hypothetical protein
MTTLLDQDDEDDIGFVPFRPIPAAVAHRVEDFPPLTLAQYRKIDAAAEKARADDDARNAQRERDDERLAQARLAHESFAVQMQRSGDMSDATRRQLKKYERAVKAIQDQNNATYRRRPDSFGPLLERIWSFLRNDGGRRYRDCPVLLDLGGESESVALKTIRAAIEDRKSEHEAAKAADVPLPDAERALVNAIERKARDGRIGFKACLRREEQTTGRRAPGTIRWPEDEEVWPDGGGRFTHDRANAMVVWLFKDQIIKRGLAELRDVASDDALSDSDRRARMAELDKQILELERQEEALIRVLEAKGTSVSRRNDASVLAVLGIEVDDGTRRKSDPDDFMSDDSDDDPRGDKWAKKRGAELDARAKKARKHRKGDWLG